jgi:hypothetical protein
MGTVHQTIGTMSAAKAGSHRLQGRGAQGHHQYARDEFGKKLHSQSDSIIFPTQMSLPANTW